MRIEQVLFHHVPMAQLATKLEMLLTGEHAFIIPSSVIQARQKIPDKVVEVMFNQTASGRSDGDWYLRIIYRDIRWVEWPRVAYVSYGHGRFNP